MTSLHEARKELYIDHVIFVNYMCWYILWGYLLKHFTSIACNVSVLPNLLLCSNSEHINFKWEHIFSIGIWGDEEELTLVGSLSSGAGRRGVGTGYGALRGRVDCGDATPTFARQCIKPTITITFKFSFFLFFSFSLIFWHFMLTISTTDTQKNFAFMVGDKCRYTSSRFLMVHATYTLS